MKGVRNTTKYFLFYGTNHKLGLLITAGLRPGEAYGLKWEDADLQTGRIRVQRSLERRDGQWYLKEPKRLRAAEACRCRQMSSRR